MVCVNLWLRVGFLDPKDSIQVWPMNKSLCQTLSDLFPTRASTALLGQAVPHFDLHASDDSAFHAIEWESDPTSCNDQGPKRLTPTRFLKIFARPPQYWPEEHTAAFFDKLEYIDVNFIDDLRAHLRSDYMSKPCLHLFHHASFLHYCEIADDIFPANFFAETLRTLALVLPDEKGCDEVKEWFKRAVKNSEQNLPTHIPDSGQLTIKSGDSGLVPLDNAVVAQRAVDSMREFGRYQYWSQHLISIHRLMRDCKPHTIKQWYYDRRDNGQRTTVLIAVTALSLTATFSLVQVILAGVNLHNNNRNH